MGNYLAFDLGASSGRAIIGKLNNGTLSLEEVQVSIIFSHRSDGIKFSVRSEIDSVHAGELIRRTLTNLGTGGGHASMAGGLIPEENVAMLGKDPENRIIQLFLEKIEAKHLS